MMLFRQLFDPETSTYTYLIADLATKTAILVDSVLEQVERDAYGEQSYLQLLTELGLTLKYCLETHIHADHITGTAKLREATGCLGIVPENAQALCADRFIKDGEVLELGSVKVKAMPSATSLTNATPGHTDSHNAYLVNGTHLLTGDALLIRGCGRTDFQGGNAGMMYDAITQQSVCKYCWLWLISEGLGVGVLTGLVGVGGGFAIVPALVLLGNVPMKQAIGTSLLIIVFNSVAGFLGYLGHVSLNWNLMLSFIVAASVGTIFDAYLAEFVPANRLQKSFGYFLLAVAALVLVQNRQQPRSAPRSSASLSPQVENHSNARLVTVKRL